MPHKHREAFCLMILIELARSRKIKSKPARPGLDQPDRWVKA
jgi:hypothetical protein